MTRWVLNLVWSLRAFSATTTDSKAGMFIRLRSNKDEKRPLLGINATSGGDCCLVSLRIEDFSSATESTGKKKKLTSGWSHECSQTNCLRVFQNKCMSLLCFWLEVVFVIFCSVFESGKGIMHLGSRFSVLLLDNSGSGHLWLGSCFLYFCSGFKTQAMDTGKLSRSPMEPLSAKLCFSAFLQNCFWAFLRESKRVSERERHAETERDERERQR